MKVTGGKGMPFYAILAIWILNSAAMADEPAVPVEPGGDEEVCTDCTPPREYTPNDCYFDLEANRCRSYTNPERQEWCWNYGEFTECGYLFGLGSDDAASKSLAAKYAYPTVEEIAVDLYVARENNLPIKLNGIDLSSAVLPYLDLRGAELRKARFESSYLPYADFEGANLTEASLYGSVLMNGSFKSANLTRATLTKGIFSYADFTQAAVDSVESAEAEFSFSVGKYASFTNSNLTDANFRGANLIDTKWNNSNLTSVDFTDADLSSNRWGAPSNVYPYTVFAGATMTQTRFHYSNLCGTDFSETGLSAVQAQYHGSVFDSRTVPNGEYSPGYPNASLPFNQTSRKNWNEDAYTRLGAIFYSNCGGFTPFAPVSHVTEGSADLGESYRVDAFHKLRQDHPNIFVDISRPNDKERVFVTRGGEQRLVYVKKSEVVAYRTIRVPRSGPEQHPIYADVYRLTGTASPLTHPTVIADVNYYDANDAKWLNITQVALEMALHMVPFGASADYFSEEGLSWDFAQSLAMDVANIASFGAAKSFKIMGSTLKLGKAQQNAVRATAIAINAGGISIRGGQAVADLFAGEYAAAAGKVGEIFLRLLFLRMDAKKLLKAWSKPTVKKTIARARSVSTRKKVQQLLAGCAALGITQAPPMNARDRLWAFFQRVSHWVIPEAIAASKKDLERFCRRAHDGGRLAKLRARFPFYDPNNVPPAVARDLLEVEKAYRLAYPLRDGNVLRTADGALANPPSFGVLMTKDGRILLSCSGKDPAQIAGFAQAMGPKLREVMGARADRIQIITHTRSTLNASGQVVHSYTREYETLISNLERQGGNLCSETRLFMNADGTILDFKNVKGAVVFWGGVGHNGHSMLKMPGKYMAPCEKCARDVVYYLEQMRQRAAGGN